jgi:hypothetical protein
MSHPNMKVVLQTIENKKDFQLEELERQKRM